MVNKKIVLLVASLFVVAPTIADGTTGNLSATNGSLEVYNPDADDSNSGNGTSLSDGALAGTIIGALAGAAAIVGAFRKRAKIKALLVDAKTGLVQAKNSLGGSLRNFGAEAKAVATAPFRAAARKYTAARTKISDWNKQRQIKKIATLQAKIAAAQAKLDAAQAIATKRASVASDSSAHVPTEDEARTKAAIKIQSIARMRQARALRAQAARASTSVTSTAQSDASGSSAHHLTAAPAGMRADVTATAGDATATRKKSKPLPSGLRAGILAAAKLGSKSSTAGSTAEASDFSAAPVASTSHVDTSGTPDASHTPTPDGVTAGSKPVVGVHTAPAAEPTSESAPESTLAQRTKKAAMDKKMKAREAERTAAAVTTKSTASSSAATPVRPQKTSTVDKSATAVAARKASAAAEAAQRAKMKDVFAQLTKEKPTPVPTIPEAVPTPASESPQLETAAGSAASTLDPKPATHEVAASRAAEPTVAEATAPVTSAAASMSKPRPRLKPLALLDAAATAFQQHAVPKQVLELSTPPTTSVAAHDMFTAAAKSPQRTHSISPLPAAAPRVTPSLSAQATRFRFRSSVIPAVAYKGTLSQPSYKDTSPTKLRTESKKVAARSVSPARLGSESSRTSRSPALPTAALTSYGGRGRSFGEVGSKARGGAESLRYLQHTLSSRAKTESRR